MTRPTHDSRDEARDEARGVALCALAAGCFGVLPVMAKSAITSGASPLGLLAVRFTIAAALFWALAIGSRGRQPLPPLGLAGRGVLLGAGYAAEAGLFFSALGRIDAGLVELLLYTYPGLVTLGAMIRGRDAPSRNVVAALVLASAGLLAVLSGSATGGADTVGILLALGAATVYAMYVTAAETVASAMSPFVLAALVASGAAGCLWAVGAAGADLRLGHLDPASVTGLAVVSTVVPMAALFAGIARLGASRASIISTLEPVVTVVVAAVALGETLSAPVGVGAATVVAGVVLLRTRSEPAPGGPGAPPLRYRPVGQTHGGREIHPSRRSIPQTAAQTRWERADR